MQRVAGSGLLNLDQQHLAIAHDDSADGFALLGTLAEARRRNARARTAHLNDGTRVRPARPETVTPAHRPFITDRPAPDALPLPPHRHNRHYPLTRHTHPA